MRLINMKNISFYDAEKYKTEEYLKVSENIYKIGDEFVTSLSFEQEPELNEGETPDDISQYPLEDVLDKFYVYVNDFYEELNEQSEKICYLEFAGSEIEDIKGLLTIIGKHVYNKEDEEGYIDLIIE